VFGMREIGGREKATREVEEKVTISSVWRIEVSERRD